MKKKGRALTWADSRPSTPRTPPLSPRAQVGRGPSRTAAAGPAPLPLRPAPAADVWAPRVGPTRRLPPPAGTDSAATDSGFRARSRFEDPGTTVLFKASASPARAPITLAAISPNPERRRLLKTRRRHPPPQAPPSSFSLPSSFRGGELAFALVVSRRPRPCPRLVSPCPAAPPLRARRGRPWRRRRRPAPAPARGPPWTAACRPARPVHWTESTPPPRLSPVHHGPVVPRAPPGPQRRHGPGQSPAATWPGRPRSPRAPAAFAEKPSGLFKINPQSCSFKNI